MWHISNQDLLGVEARKVADTVAARIAHVAHETITPGSETDTDNTVIPRHPDFDALSDSDSDSQAEN